jgi:hypothetical protein
MQLTTARRKQLPTKAFALKGRRYPIEDKSHARNALARISQHGTAAEKTRVRSAVHRKFPGIGQDGKKMGKLREMA